MTTSSPATCTRCGRVLTSAASVAAGVGPVCARRIREHAAAALAAHSPAAIEKALELIADGAVLPVPVRPGVPLAVGFRRYLAVSSDGTVAYETTSTQCTCRAAQFGRDCYHRAAVDLLAA